MSFLSNLVKQVAPIVATVSPDPITKGIATAATMQYQRQEASYQRKLAEQQQEQRRKNMAMNYGGNFDPVSGTGLPSTTTQQAGLGGFFGGVTDFFRGAGDVIGSAFGSGIPQLLGLNRPRGVAQQPAITTVTNVGAQESQGSGSIQAGFGSAIPTLVSGARSLIKSPVGQLLTGTGVGTAVAMIGADGKPMRITRKMKSQLKSLLNQTGNNYALVGDFLNLNTDQMLFILNKRFRNDGPVVTKAALRKTRSTIRKMKNMCDMYDDLRPAARRRTPMRRATRSSTTLIKN